MNIKKAVCIILVLTSFIPCFASCSYIERFTPKKPQTAKYENSDYHFTLTYPSYFSEIKEIPSEENGDEYRIELRHGKNDMIVVDISYKTASNLYEFAELSNFDKSKITPLSMSVFPNAINSFSYDKRVNLSFQKPAFYIYAMTKRMLYTISYEYDSDNENGSAVCDALAFEFDTYANVPKESQFMSPSYVLAYGYSSVTAPADATVMLYPNPSHMSAIKLDEETGSVVNQLYYAYRRITEVTGYSYFVHDLPETASFTLPELAKNEYDENMAAVLTELLGTGSGVTNIRMDEKGTYSNERLVNYRKIYFTCYYNGKPASGTVSVGFTSMLKPYRSVYLVINDASAAERVNYECTLKSIKI